MLMLICLFYLQCLSDSPSHVVSGRQKNQVPTQCLMINIHKEGAQGNGDQTENECEGLAYTANQPVLT